MIKQSVGNYKKILKEILKEEIFPLFLENSFKRNGNFLFKVEQDLVKFVDMEYFRFNTYVSFFYWFNFYIVTGSFECENKINLKLLLTKGTVVLKKRLGYLWGEEEQMYQITSATNNAALIEKMKTDITDYLIPFFDKLNSTDEVINILLDKNKELGISYYSYTIAVIYGKAGRLEESKKFLLESTAHPEIVKKTARLYGINLG